MKKTNKMMNEGERIELIEYGMGKDGWAYEIKVDGIRYDGKDYKIATNIFGKKVLKEV